MRVRQAFLLGLAGLTAATAGKAQVHSSERADGPWQVGFAVVHAADSARRMENGAIRPLDIGVWYPTREAGRLRVSYREYFLASATGEELQGFTDFLVSHGAAESAVTGWLTAPMRASRNAPASGERFPLVLLSQGNGHALADQAPLAEFLASHGYVVATTPSPMRVTGPLTDEGQVGSRAAEQATDLERAADILFRLRPDIAGNEYGIVGHSFGARAGLLLMMRGSRVAALVSLDGGIGTATGREAMEKVPGYRIDAVRSPILHFYEERDDYMTPDLTLLRSLTGSERWIRLVPLRHHLFTSLGAASIDHPALRRAVAADDTTAAAYSAVERSTLDFLDAFLKGDPTNRARLDGPAELAPLGRLERL